MSDAVTVAVIAGIAGVLNAAVYAWHGTLEDSSRKAIIELRLLMQDHIEEVRGEHVRATLVDS